MTTTTSPAPSRRNLVIRSDGKTVNVPRRQGHLFVCATGCCCGHTERGHAPVPVDLYDREWERRKWRNKVHLTIGGCLGPCVLSNVTMLIFDGHTLYFQSLNNETLIVALLDYVDAMLAADAYLPPPPMLAELHFTSFRWEDRPDGCELDDRRERLPAPSKAPTGNSGFLFLTHSDTDLALIDRARAQLPADFPAMRAFGLNHLKNDVDVDAFLDNVLPGAEVIVVRLMGGRANFARGLDRVTQYVRETGAWLLCVPGTDALDPELTALSTAGVPVAHEAFAYLQFGGIGNYVHLLRFLADHLLACGFGFDAPIEQPRHGTYHPDLGGECSVEALLARHKPGVPTLGVLFYRSHLLAGNTDFVDALVHEIERAGANALPVFAYSLKDGASDDDLPHALRYFIERVDAVVATMSFAMGHVNADGPTPGGWSVAALERLGVPVIQAITLGSSYAQWDASPRGLPPLETAMNVALPEFDGRIIGVPISFKEELTSASGGTITRYVPRTERVARAVALALRFTSLRRKPNADKRIAMVLTNYNAKASRIGNAVGLDTPASVLRLLHALCDAGYDVGDPLDLPPDGDTLLSALIDRCSYDTEVLTEEQLRNAAASVPSRQYAEWFDTLPERNRREMTQRWGDPPGESYVHDDAIALAGLRFGNVFIAIQPPRGYGMDPNLIYHQPDLPPTHSYHALYRWIKDDFAADAMVHVGKHGTLEWLPGKSVGLSEACYPDLLLGDLPLVYPFIVNDPGEGAQAKRRAHAVVVDHLTPPMTTADAYGKLDELARLVDEYYQVEALDPTKLPMLQQQIWELIVDARLDADITLMIQRLNQQGDHTHDWDPQVTDDGVPTTLAEMRSKDFAHLIENLDWYLCELGSALIRGGLHTLGEEYAEERLRDLVAAMVRLPNLDVPSLRAGVAAAFGLELDALLQDLGARTECGALAHVSNRPIATTSDALEAIDALCLELLSRLQSEGWPASADRHRAIAESVLQTPSLPVAARTPEAKLVEAGEASASPKVETPLAEREIPSMEEDSMGEDSLDTTPRKTPPASANASASVLKTLAFVAQRLIPSLHTSATDEIRNVLQALDGRYVPAGPSGAPTRGMAHVLPTGRNFYAIDPRTMPSRSAWRVGQQLANELVARHVRDSGKPPRSVGLSIWGTSAMRTHGDDIAQAFALLGVRPIWQSETQRLIGSEIVPLEELGRPRVDVVCRISGFFRDAFPHIPGVLDEAVQKIADLDEPPDQNPLRARYLADRAKLETEGASPEVASRQARYRVFGSRPGTYGAGILPLIDEGNWQTAQDFATAYINWGGFAYTGEEFGVDARPTFETVLARVEVAAKNQDNREHDIFDSDDYMQFHGGMIATIRALSGASPRRYFGDTSDPARAQVRDLKQEALRVFRSRVVNPKWIESITRHGYKGALELAATVDYLFGYDATADIVDDWMYEEITRTYVADAEMRAFFERSNPWALKDVSARLLEAVDRGLWSAPSEDALHTLRSAYLAADATLEGRSEVAAP